MEQTRDPFVGFVEFGVLPDHPHPHQQVWKELRNLFGCYRLETLARLEQGLQELEVIAGFFCFVLDVKCQISKSLGISTINPLQKLDYLLKFRFFKLFINMLEVFSSPPPIVNFIERPRILILMLGISIIDDFPDLFVPVNDGGL